MDSAAQAGGLEIAAHESTRVLNEDCLYWNRNEISVFRIVWKWPVQLARFSAYVVAQPNNFASVDGPQADDWYEIHAAIIAGSAESQ